MLGGKYLNLRLFSEKKNSLTSNNSENALNSNLQNENKLENNDEKTKNYRDKRIIHEGWLNKWTNIIGSYRPRYFVLENGILRYSIDKYSPTKETFVLSHCKIRVCPDDPLHFEIETSEQGILYLKTDLPEQKHKWYISFKKAQLNYLHGSYKKGFMDVNNFNNSMSKNSSFLTNIIKNTNDFDKNKINNIIGDLMQNNGIQKVENFDKESSEYAFDYSESNFKTNDAKKINLDELFICSTDFEDKSPTLCLMENIVSLKQITRDIIKNSEYNQSKSILNKMKLSNPNKISINYISSLLSQLTNSIECIDTVIEKYINCTEMLLKEENIQSKCMNKSLKLLAKQNYFLEKSQEKKILGDLDIKVKNKLEKLNIYESDQESEDLFFDCDETFSDKNIQSSVSIENDSSRSSTSIGDTEENVKKNTINKKKKNEKKLIALKSNKNRNVKSKLESKSNSVNNEFGYKKKINAHESFDDQGLEQEFQTLKKNEEFNKISENTVNECSFQKEEHGINDYQSNKKKNDAFNVKNKNDEIVDYNNKDENNTYIYTQNNDEPFNDGNDNSNERNDYSLIRLCNTKEKESINFSKIDVYTDKTIKRRKKLPSPRTEIKISLWSLLKDCIGKDLSRIGMPIYLNEPSSFLQRLAEDFQYIYLLKYASEQEESTSRLAFVTAFTISPYASVIGRTFKPFNPLLGETYELTHRKFYFISEQVVHHPPITAYHCHNDYMENFASIMVNVQILGKSIEVTIPGSNHLILKYKKNCNNSKSMNKTKKLEVNKNISNKNDICDHNKIKYYEKNTVKEEMNTKTYIEKKDNNICNETFNDNNNDIKNYDVHKHDFYPIEKKEDFNKNCIFEKNIENSKNKSCKKSKIKDRVEKNNFFILNNQNNSEIKIDGNSKNENKNSEENGCDRNYGNTWNTNKLNENNIKKGNSLNENGLQVDEIENDEYLKKKKGEGGREKKKTKINNSGVKSECSYEHYTYQRANMIIHNIIFGKLWVELHGNILIRNHNNGDFSIVRYIRKGWFDKEIHKVRGIVCDRFKNVIFFIYGKWSQEIYIAYVKNLKKLQYDTYFFNEDGTENTQFFNKNTLNDFINNFDWQFYENNIENLKSVCVWRAQKRPKNSDMYYGFNYMTVELNEITPEYDRLNGASIACTDSRFRPDQRNYENGNIEVAMLEKQRLENKQRQNSKKYGANNSYKPKWFYKNKDPIYKDNDIYLFNHKYWLTKKNKEFSDSPDIF
ncbi:oxysterol-binding protein-related protein 2, putative [Plasmodium gallinaceum]|uniref:Oxysterol-binding protein-related protein 2, putative n=1 Tax=Plasmodium gallinaceum TaxID=5849 RepID=A0A1J1GYJ9_PLAGA|nr:oxysterol-binding protein-related protein 2, putative [Plasmodium gallinaceum]CRG96368.1 oxysterol-binding protein-related protein 2, putative [Plasmodium gallinaceum]